MTIDKQKLKELAEAATVGRNYDRLDSAGGGLKYTCTGDDGSLVLQVDHKNDKFGFIGPNNQADEAFFLAATPSAILALLAEIEHLQDLVAEWRRSSPVLPSRACAAIIEQLKAENEALREDAENWKTVQRAMEQLKSDEQGAAIWSACSRILISLASDLNSARSVVTEEGVTKDGAEIGDWRVTVERLAMAKEASHG